ncbi:MAG: M20/M25/M40 family metallo-hydrolase [Crocinitomicaceae bacterium]|nr:M20/M25/M40 family metallo-hydrolase [Crocinitomicaceae bacterium]
MKKFFLSSLILSTPFLFFAQKESEMAQKIMDEVYKNSQVEALAHELMDDIGPRLVGTPQMKKAHDWAVAKYTSWGIPAENQQYGEWKAWERGITHIDMVFPRIQSLHGTQLAWSPGTSSKGVTAEVIILPEIKDSISFQKWLPSVKGKIVMIGMLQPTGRPDSDWKEWATEASFEKMKKDREELKKAWDDNLKKSGYTKRTLPEALEKAGAVAIVDSYWSQGFGAQKIFGAKTKKIPTVDIQLEDYGMLYRMVEHGDKPQLKIVAESKDLGIAPTFNTIAQIKGSVYPDEYVLLSAHFDSWDGGTGATDNGTGTILMMEVMRILKKLYPNPKRTIIVGHWGSEEQGLNGSRAFVVDHPEIVQNIQVSFNQDNGTGRIKSINGSGFVNAYEYLSRWLSVVPDTIQKVETNFPGEPGRGGTDYASFIAAGIPAFNLNATSWSYWNYTWHTNLDTYDKIVFDDLKNNVILTAILTYMASEDNEKASREQMILPIDKKTGERQKWPEIKQPERKGGF